MSANGLSEERIRELLEPLQADAPIEYIHQYKVIAEFNRRLKSLDVLYAEVSSKVALLEQELAKYKKETTLPNLWENFS